MGSTFECGGTGWWALPRLLAPRFQLPGPRLWFSALVRVIPLLLPWQTHPTAPAIDVAGSSVAAAPTVAVAGSHTRALRPSLLMLLLLQLQLRGSFSCCRRCRQMDVPLSLTLHSPLLFVAPYL